MRRILVTGGSGSLGNTFIKGILKDSFNGVIHNVDVVPTGVKDYRLTNHLMDIRSNNIEAIILRNKIDTVIHLVAIIGGKRISEKTVHEIEIMGLQNILNICVRTNIKQFVFASSGSVYGYHAKLPNLIDESYPLFEDHVIQYGRNKVIAEKMIARYTDQYNLNTTVLRICSILGENSSNLICEWFERKRIFGLKGYATPFSFVWDQDLANVIEEAIDRRIIGIYNISGDGYITLKEIAKVQSKRYIEISDKFLSRIFGTLNRIVSVEYKKEYLDFIKYRPLLSVEKYQGNFNYVLKKNSLNAFLSYINR